MKFFFHKSAYLFLIVVLAAASGMFLTQTPTVLAACSPSEPSVANTLTGITPSSQTFDNPSSIFINASGHTAFKCVSGFGFRATTLSWSITNGLGQIMISNSWNSPADWDNQVAAGAVNYDGTPLGFVNGYTGTAIDASSWPAGAYTLTYTSDSAVETVGTVVSLNSTLTVTRPSPCAIGTFSCDPATATLAWSTSNCSSVSISPTIGNVPGTGSTQGLVNGDYTITADDQTAARHCPAPMLSTSGGGSQTVTPGQPVTLPSFNFDNTGESGSVIHYTGCDPNTPPPTGGITVNEWFCPPPKDLIAP